MGLREVARWRPFSFWIAPLRQTAASGLERTLGYRFSPLRPRRPARERVAASPAVLPPVSDCQLARVTFPELQQEGP